MDKKYQVEFRINRDGCPWLRTEPMESLTDAEELEKIFDAAGLEAQILIITTVFKD